VVRHIGESLVTAMEMALASGPPEAAQLVAGESVVNAETKDHLNWELLRTVSEKASGPTATAISAACDEVEEEEDEHLYHTMGWTRELWIESLGMPAVLPPPEEVKKVKTAIGASRAEYAVNTSYLNWGVTCNPPEFRSCRGPKRPCDLSRAMDCSPSLFSSASSLAEWRPECRPGCRRWSSRFRLSSPLR
jgi:hypothetical protein